MRDEALGFKRKKKASIHLMRMEDTGRNWRHSVNNFGAEIIRRKKAVVKVNYHKSPTDYENLIELHELVFIARLCYNF